MKKIRIGTGKCDKCGRECNDSAGVEIRGQIQWFCYICYKAYKQQKGE